MFRLFFILDIHVTWGEGGGGGGVLADKGSFAYILIVYSDILQQSHCYAQFGSTRHVWV